ncbi:MAG: TraB/GumN family protein [Crocinitomicaceae bacterium]
MLWEISGNGLSEPSYLYGTMHVSNKLAFNVSDSFYYCLNKTKGVALESSPESWMEDYRDMGVFSLGGYDFGSDFYKRAFKIEDPGTEVMYDLLENKNGLMNQILYRFNPGNEDYQENTYLDMFIYQAGAKNGKPIHSLEDFDEVMELSLKSMTPDQDKKRDNKSNTYLEQDAQKKYVKLEEAYRRGDLDQIDSLTRSNTPTSVYHKYFIVERNKNMVRRMDSIMHQHSIFTGIGAAHLPGEEGAIELLRKEGYKVRAVSSKSTSKAHKMRKKLEKQYKAVAFTETSTSDGFIKLYVPGKLYEMPTSKRGKLEYLCPEPINGGYFSVVRLFTFAPIFNKDQAYYQSTFDSLLYPATPGDILKVENLELNGHKGYRILTTTSKNARVNYNVFFTPTEIIVFKGSGIEDYVEHSEPQSFFSKIVLAPQSSEWKDVAPKFGGAQWSMKGMVSGQDMIDEMDETNVFPLYQSFDQESGDYFQVMRYTLNDLDYIEEDSFDLAYLGEQYAKQLGCEIERTEYKHNGSYASVRQELKADKNHQNQVADLSIKIITKRGLYYLMSTTSKNENATAFFDSFKFTKHQVDQEYTLYEDTTLFYTVNTIKKDDKPDYKAMGYNLYRNYNSDDEEDKSYLSKTDSKYHTNPKTNEVIYVGYTKFHDYQGADSRNDFWDYQIKRLETENQFIVSQKKHKDEDSLTISFMLTDTGSAKGIYTQMHLQHGVLYTLQSLIDTLEGPTEYVSTFYDSYTPMDTLIGRDVFEDKAEVFFSHVFGEDSLNRVNAMKSISKVIFEEKDVPGVVKTYYEHEFDEEKETEYREDLIMSLGNIEVQEAYDFLYAVYDSNNFNSDLQFIVLKSFSYTETQEAYNAIKKLLIDNTPFTEKSNKLNFFNNLYDSLDLAEGFFPEMLDVAQYPEYKPYIVEMLAHGYLNAIFEFEDFSSEKKSIYRNANIELKRTVANQKDDKKKKNNYYYGYSQSAEYQSLFLDYYALMCAFKKEKHIDSEAFFEDIYRINDKKFLLEAEIVHHKLGLPVDTAKINEVSKDLDHRVWAYNRLEAEEMLSYFPAEITQEEMAFSLLYNTGYDKEKDTVSFVKKVEVDNGKNTGYIYFFKRKTEDTKNWMIDYVGIQPLEDDQFNTEQQDKKKGLSVVNDQEMEQTIEKTVTIFELKNRKRVVVNDYNWGNWGGLF